MDGCTGNLLLGDRGRGRLVTADARTISIVRDEGDATIVRVAIGLRKRCCSGGTTGADIHSPVAALFCQRESVIGFGGRWLLRAHNYMI